MKRRDFLKGALPLSLSGLALGGMPVRALAGSLMSQSFSCADLNDRVLVLVQLHGGNDGLNTIIPIDQYATYKNLRPIIGIQDFGSRRYIDTDTTLPVQNQVGLHPDMTGIKSLYDEGFVNIIQDVSYPDNNGSHFRGTDIWLSGNDGTSDDSAFGSGWFGRYLDHYYPSFPTDYPNTDMPDPPGLEFGSHIVSLGFHREAGIPMGLTISNDPSGFFGLVSSVGGALPTTFPTSDYGEELRFLTEMEQSTQVYAPRLTNLYNAGTNAAGITYPDTYHTLTSNNYHNQLSPQLKTVARLLSGGSKTKVFLTRMSGFDTHANQAIAGKPSYGGHSALMYHLSSAIKSFMDDLAEQGLADRVMLATFSEFGRQVAENGDWGTDHGTSAPMIVVGRGVKGGVTGTNPNLSNLHNNNLVGFQHDYRQVWTTLAQDWLGGNNGTLQTIGFNDFINQKLDLVNNAYIDDQGNTVDFVADVTCDETPYDPTTNPPTAVEDELDTPKLSFSMSPNPASDRVTITLESDHLVPATLMIYNLAGVQMRQYELRLFTGENTKELDISDLSAGHYLVRIIANKGSRLNAFDLPAQKLVVR